MHLFVTRMLNTVILSTYVIGISTAVGSKQKVHILSLFPGGWRSGLNIAAQMAAKDINDAKDILTDYEFILHVNNTNVSYLLFV